MEVPENESKNPDCHITSAAAFVDGGIQEACDDACSICLEEFCESDPSTVTSCKHEFHLQCILEWCQRSSQCPMCWQSISLKDPNSQELLEAVERERNFRAAPPRNRTIFHHPTLGDFELQLPVGTNDSELEERIMQHLAAAAAMGRAHHIGRRDGQRSRSSAHGRQHFLVFSAHPSTLPSESVSSSLTQLGEGSESAAISAASPSSPLISHGDEPSQQIPQRASVRAIPSSLISGSNSSQSNQRGTLNSLHDLHLGHSRSAPPNQDRAGPSELQSFSETLKSRFSAVSMRYKESFSRSTRGWKERLFSRNNSMSELGSEVQRELNAGIASVSRMMEGLETRENTSITNDTSESTRLGDSSGLEHINRDNGETPCPLDEGKAAASGATSSSSSC
ncbi:E3 ubiquitin-protein ligase RHF2A-like isoform X2 [Tripterygium wilfordii]|uniref:E3 ubiquitin-protein ligase RHF2A-like isoform X2 n=1 Tax=Tripterygium wilfordii TaxID=458696 RepID=UPI0018F7EEDF|nr:E3 ubiquitin-protein ligase RHF2A-like isoform X2 [Tripterygium wilfordii]